MSSTEAKAVRNLKKIVSRSISCIGGDLQQNNTRIKNWKCVVSVSLHGFVLVTFFIQLNKGTRPKFTVAVSGLFQIAGRWCCTFSLPIKTSIALSKVKTTFNAIGNVSVRAKKATKQSYEARLILNKAQENGTASKTRGRKKLYWHSLEKMSWSVEDILNI